MQVNAGQCAKIKEGINDIQKKSQATHELRIKTFRLSRKQLLRSEMGEHNSERSERTPSLLSPNTRHWWENSTVIRSCL